MTPSFWFYLILALLWKCLLSLFARKPVFAQYMCFILVVMPTFPLCSSNDPLLLVLPNSCCLMMRLFVSYNKIYSFLAVRAYEMPCCTCTVGRAQQSLQGILDTCWASCSTGNGTNGLFPIFFWGFRGSTFSMMSLYSSSRYLRYEPGQK